MANNPNNGKCVTVTQFSNPRFDSSQPVVIGENDEFVYCVDSTVNTLVVHINQRLSRCEVQHLIDDGFKVTVKPVK